MTAFKNGESVLYTWTINSSKGRNLKTKRQVKFLYATGDEAVIEVNTPLETREKKVPLKSLSKIKENP